MKYNYEVFEGDQLVCSGCASDISAAIGIRNDYIYKYVKDQRFYEDKYLIKFAGVYHKPEPPKPKKKKVDKLDYYFRHLDKYGNTVVRLEDEKRVDKLLKELEERGYKCNLKVYKHYSGINIALVGSTFDKRLINVDYILELIK